MQPGANFGLGVRPAGQPPGSLMQNVGAFGALAQSSMPFASQLNAQPKAGLPAALHAFASTEAVPAAKRIKKRAGDRIHMPEKVAHIVHESPAFNLLLEQQRRVDDYIHHRRSEARDALQKPERVKRKLRLTIFNHHLNQKQGASGPQGAGTSSSTAPTEPPSWVLVIHGRLLDTAEPGLAAAGGSGPLSTAAAATAAAAGVRAGGVGMPPSSTSMAAAALQGALAAAGLPPGAAATANSALGGVAAQAAAAAATTTAQAQGSASSSIPKHPMTHFLRRVKVELEPGQYPGAQGSVVWERAVHAGAHKDSLEVRRKGSQGVKAKITIEVDYQPERFVLVPPLAELLGMQHESKPRVLQALMSYLKTHKLVTARSYPNANLNNELSAVFGGVRTVNVGQLAELISPLLSPMKPIEIEYMIKVDGPSPAPVSVYDVDVEVALPSASDRITPVLDAINVDKELSGLDEQMSVVIHRINEHRRRRAFLMGFAQSPGEFINALIASQARDLRVAAKVNAAEGRNFELERTTDVFRGKWVEDAVMRYMHRRTAAGH